jgi:hypothetical protein
MLELPDILTYGFIALAVFVFAMLWLSLYKGTTERIRKRTHTVALLMMAWLVFQSTLSLNRWYMDRKAMPPHIAFPIFMSIVVMCLLFFTPRGRRFLDGMNLTVLVFMHTVRLGVEYALYWLAYYKQVPWSMTFYGHNYDIIIGATAPLVAYFGYYKKRLSPNLLAAWNILGIALLLNVVITGIGASPSPMQGWDFNQPNYAVLHFPFQWIPSFIVPAVMLSHLLALRYWWLWRKG